VTHLLDTNVCVAVLRGVRGVRRKLQTLRPDDVGVSTVTIYELQTGVERCRDPKAEGRKVAMFLQPLHVLDFDRDAAVQAALVRADLEKSGCVIAPYDLLLAGQALSLGVVLVTRNTGEFGRVQGLQVENWED
jgi:tRNA(fMet)-specific endonuclease VapC